jgi:O-acetyl-ADP-ribose deacetylase (regulator of RNase III)
MGLGESQLVKVESELWVSNIIGQHGIGVGSGGRPPIRYDALKKGFQATARWASIHGATVHMPRIGAGLAGGSWPSIEGFIKNELVRRNVEVTVYDP